MCICFFFFKQKTAYERRISDWSSDVCSSDLGMKTCSRPPRGSMHMAVRTTEESDCWLAGSGTCSRRPGVPAGRRPRAQACMRSVTSFLARSDARRVGKECVSTCKSGWVVVHEKKKSIYFYKRLHYLTP